MFLHTFILQFKRSFLLDPACQNINTNNHCYVMDPLCQSKTLIVESNDSGVFYTCFTVCGIAFLIIGAILLYLYLKQRRKKGNDKMIILKKKNCFLPFKFIFHFNKYLINIEIDSKKL